MGGRASERPYLRGGGSGGQVLGRVAAARSRHLPIGFLPLVWYRGRSALGAALQRQQPEPQGAHRSPTAGLLCTGCPRSPSGACCSGTGAAAPSPWPPDRTWVLKRGPGARPFSCRPS